jgi:lipopolysaccharide biosynthesis regulator YciM
MGDSYMAENRVDDAVEIWRKMIKVIPDEAHLVLNRLKKALFEIGRFGDISDICQEVLKVSPNNLEALLVLADYHSKKAEYNLALEFLTKAFDEHPESRLPAIQLAKHYLLLDDKQKLKDLIRKLDEKFQIIEREYSCRRCGHKSKQKLWLCPECRAVDTFVI